MSSWSATAALKTAVDRSLVVDVENKELLELEESYRIPVYAKESDKAVHIMGLLSDGGVHSHLNHLKALCDKLQLFRPPSNVLLMMSARSGRSNVHVPVTGVVVPSSNVATASKSTAAGITPSTTSSVASGG